MEWIVKTLIILATLIGGRVVSEQPIAVPEPIVETEAGIVETQTWMILETEEKQVEEFQLVEYWDSDVVSAVVPNLPIETLPEDRWAMFWALNPNLLTDGISTDTAN